jgi:hypothetical protein
MPTFLGSAASFLKFGVVLRNLSVTYVPVLQPPSGRRTGNVLSVLDYFERQLSIVDRTLFLKLETVSQSEQVNGNIPELVEHLLAEFLPEIASIAACSEKESVRQFGTLIKLTTGFASCLAKSSEPSRVALLFLCP